MKHLEGSLILTLSDLLMINDLLNNMWQEYAIQQDLWYLKIKYSERK